MISYDILFIYSEPFYVDIEENAIHLARYLVEGSDEDNKTNNNIL